MKEYWNVMYKLNSRYWALKCFVTNTVINTELFYYESDSKNWKIFTVIPKPFSTIFYEFLKLYKCFFKDRLYRQLSKYSINFTELFFFRVNVNI